MNRHVLAAAALLVGAPALAQTSNISAANKYCWGENVGFLDFRDANSAAQGVIVHLTYLSGYAWGENAGWISLGNGTSPSASTCFQYPAPGAQTGATYGVNIGAGDYLSGYAWGENIGWVNFNTQDASRPALQWARYDRAGKRLRGYAWGENVGWINLDSAIIFVGSTLCRADADGNGLIEPADIALFVNVWFCSLQTGGSGADFDANGSVQPADVSLFVSAWFTALGAGGC